MAGPRVNGIFFAMKQVSWSEAVLLRIPQQRIKMLCEACKSGAGIQRSHLGNTEVAPGEYRGRTWGIQKSHLGNTEVTPGEYRGHTWGIQRSHLGNTEVTPGVWVSPVLGDLLPLSGWSDTVNWPHQRIMHKELLCVHFCCWQF